MRGRAAAFFAPLLVLAIHLIALRSVPVDLRPEARVGAGPTETELRRAAREKRAAMREKRWADAKEATLRLLRFAPSDHASLGDLAEIERALGNDAAETAALERYLLVAPVPVHACPELPFSYRRQQRMDDYLDACERCLAFDPKNVDSLFCVAHASERLGDLDRAREFYERGLELSPGYADLSLGLARIAHRTGRPDEARRRALEALAKRPGDGEALSILDRLGGAPAREAER